MDSKVRLLFIILIVLIFKGSDRIRYYITTLRRKKPAAVIKNNSEPTHNFVKEIVAAKNLMAQLIAEKWNFELEKSGVKVFIKPGSEKINAFRGDGKFDRPYSIQEIISVIKSPFARKEWDGRYASGEILETNGDTFITHSIQKGTFPFAAREFSTIGKIDLQDKHASLVSTSITHPSIEYDQSKVRGHLYLGGWDITRNNNSLLVSYIVQVDVGGSIPPVLLKSIQTQSPLCVAAVIKYLDENGPLPHIIHESSNSMEDIKIIKEEYQPNKSYYLTIKNQISTSKSVMIALPSKRFPGAKIIISGHNSCKLVPNDAKYAQWTSSATSNIVIVTLLGSQETKIEISSTSQDFSINGSLVTKGINLKVDTDKNSEIVSIISPTLESAERMLAIVDASWETAVDKVANSINCSRNFAKRNASRVITLAKLVLFH